jgi:cytochrome P450
MTPADTPDPGTATDFQVYPDVVAFVTECIAPSICRPTGRGRGKWCPEWWRHPEAVRRLTALWHAWERLRLEGGAAVSTWWLYHFDGHFRVLTDPEYGPFQSCSHEGHTDKLRPLVCEPPPPDWTAEWSKTP